jgi:ribulose kinase
VCKWTYSAEKGWDDSFWKMIGLEDLIDDNYSKIGKIIENPKYNISGYL